MRNLEPFSILYAEDDKQIRDGYVLYFKSIFEHVYHAADGKEAFSMYKKFNPDILLFDINMPHIDGLTLVEKIRETDDKVKIIILTAHQDEEKLLKAIPLGLVTYLKKPIKRRELEGVLLTVVSTLKQDNKELSLIKLSSTIYWDKNRNILVDNDTTVHLTKNEIILLNILSSGSKIHYSLDELLEEFWLQLHQKEMTQSSIRNIIKRIKVKLPDDILENHYGVGYKLCIQ